MDSISQYNIPSSPLDISSYRDDPEYVTDLVNSLSAHRPEWIEMDEADVEEWLAGGNDEKMLNLLYGVDIQKGALQCGQCGTEYSIKDSILHC